MHPIDWLFIPLAIAGWMFVSYLAGKEGWRKFDRKSIGLAIFFLFGIYYCIDDSLYRNTRLSKDFRIIFVWTTVIAIWFIFLRIGKIRNNRNKPYLQPKAPKKVENHFKKENVSDSI